MTPPAPLEPYEPEAGEQTHAPLVTSVSNVTSPPVPATALITTVSEQMLQSQNVHVNVTQQLIVTTEDKLMLCLTKFTGNVEKRGGWIAPLGILVSLVLTLATATFKDVFGVSQYTWKALFLMAAILSGGWLIHGVRSRVQAMTSKEIVDEIKKGSFSR